MDAYIEVAKQGKIQARFGSVQRPDEVKQQHAGWFDKNVASMLGGPVEKPSTSRLRAWRHASRRIGEANQNIACRTVGRRKAAKLSELVDQGYKGFTHQQNSKGDDEVVARKSGSYGWYINHRGGRGEAGELDDPKFAGPAWAEGAIAKLREARGQEGEQKPDPNASMPAAP